MRARCSASGECAGCNRFVFGSSRSPIIPTSSTSCMTRSCFISIRRSMSSCSVGEKSQIQALGRTHPVCPLKKGPSAITTLDYKRNGTATPFAAFDVLEVTSSGAASRRIGIRSSSASITRSNKAIHVILDNSATRKHPKVSKWLDHHPRFTFCVRTWMSGEAAVRTCTLFFAGLLSPCH